MEALLDAEYSAAMATVDNLDSRPKNNAIALIANRLTHYSNAFGTGNNTTAAVADFNSVANRLYSSKYIGDDTYLVNVDITWALPSSETQDLVAMGSINSLGLEQLAGDIKASEGVSGSGWILNSVSGSGHLIWQGETVSGHTHEADRKCLNYLVRPVIANDGVSVLLRPHFTGFSSDFNGFTQPSINFKYKFSIEDGLDNVFEKLPSQEGAYTTSDATSRPEYTLQIQLMVELFKP